MNVHEVIRRPLVTEKSTIGRETQNLATFAVDVRATKHDIKRAIEELEKLTGITSAQSGSESS